MPNDTDIKKQLSSCKTPTQRQYAELQHTTKKSYLESMSKPVQTRNQEETLCIRGECLSAEYPIPVETHRLTEEKPEPVQARSQEETPCIRDECPNTKSSIHEVSHRLPREQTLYQITSDREDNLCMRGEYHTEENIVSTLNHLISKERESTPGRESEQILEKQPETVKRSKLKTSTNMELAASTFEQTTTTSPIQQIKLPILLKPNQTTTIKIAVKSEEWTFKPTNINTRSSFHVQQENNQHTINITTTNITNQSLQKHSMIGLIKPSTYTCSPIKTESIPFQLDQMITTNQQPKTFQQLLALYKDLDFLRNDKTIILKGDNLPVVVSVSRTTMTKKIQIDQSFLEQKNIHFQATQFKKTKRQQTTFCIILHIYGPKGIKIPKGTALARIINTDTSELPTIEPEQQINAILQIPTTRKRKQKPFKEPQQQQVYIPQHTYQRIKIGGTRGYKMRICSIQSENQEKMPLTDRSYTLEAKICEQPVEAMLDSGSSATVISESIFNTLPKEIRWTIQPTSLSFRSAQNKPLDTLGQIRINLDIQNWSRNISVIVVKELTHDLILGQNFIRTYGRYIDIENSALITKTGEKLNFQQQPKPPINIQDTEIKLKNTIVIPANSHRIIQLKCPLQIPGNTSLYIEPNNKSLEMVGTSVPHTAIINKSGLIDVGITNWLNTNVTLPRNFVLGWLHKTSISTIPNNNIQEIRDEQTTDQSFTTSTSTDTFFNTQTHLTAEEKTKIMKILEKYPSITKGLGRTNTTTHSINTEHHQPVNKSLNRKNDKQYDIIESEVQQMREKGVIEKAKSPWNSPVVLVKKPNGSWRFCVDYRHLNEITKKDVYPIPRIDETIDRLGKASIFSTIDLTSGYWQVAMSDRDKEKTAFTSRSGRWQFTVMPFGLCNAPSTFQRLMDKTLDEYRFNCCLVYLDDIIIYSTSFEEHLTHLDLICGKLAEAGLTINTAKCIFASPSLKFLGHIISKEGVQVNPTKVDAVANIRSPTSQTQLRSFLGAVGYYRKFIKNFSIIASPLFTLTHNHIKWEWSSTCQQAFTTLKQKLTSAPLLKRPDFNKPFIIHSDASTIGLGAILAQIDEGKEHVIAYASRTLNKAEKSYFATELECLAIVFGINEFRPYIFGQEFTVVTDHKALTWLAKLQETNPRLTRWILSLSQYNFNIVYRPGKSHNNADGLSRLPLDSTEETPTRFPFFPIQSNTPHMSVITTIQTLQLASAEDIVEEKEGDESQRTQQLRRSTRPRNNTKLWPDMIPSKFINDVEVKKGDKEELTPTKGNSRKKHGFISKPTLKIPDITSNDPLPLQQPQTDESTKTESDSQQQSPNTLVNKSTNTEPDEQQEKSTETRTVITTTMPNKEHQLKTDKGQPIQVTAESCKEIQEETFSLENIAKEQDKDRFWAALKTLHNYNILPEEPALAAATISAAPSYTLLQNILYYFPNSNEENLTPRIVIPIRFRNELLELYHDSPVGGHLGTEKTYQRLKEKYFWVGLYKDTKTYCSSCDVCQKVKPLRTIHSPTSHTVYIGYPWQRVALDHIGPFEINNKKFYIETYIDYFTHWPEAIIIEGELEAEKTAQNFINLICSRHGMPEELLTDQGSVFTSKLLQETCKLLNVEKIYTTPYHPQANGKNERFNGTLLTMLRTYVEKNPETWPEYLPYVLFAYRCSYIQTINTTPFRMLYGRQPTLPKEEQLTNFETIDACAYAKNLKDNLLQLHKQVREKLKKRQELNDEKSLSSKLVEFQINEEVLVKKGKRQKMEAIYEGPFKILKKTTNGAYKLDRPINGEPTSMINIHRLKKYTRRPNPPSTITTSSPEDQKK